MSRSVECPRCHAPCSLADASNGGPITCGNCQEVFAAEPVGDEAPRARGQTPAKKKSGALVWILLIVGFVLLLPAIGTVGLIGYGFYWLDFGEDTKDPVIFGVTGAELPGMRPNIGDRGGGNEARNTPGPNGRV